MYCLNCGNEIPEGCEFCPKCGKKIQNIKNDNKISKCEVNELEKINECYETKEEKTINIKNHEIKLNKKALIIAVGIAVVIVVGLIKGCVGSASVGSAGTYELSPDLEVLIESYNGSYGYIQVKNTGEEVIKDFTATFVGFDSSGNILKLGYDNCNYTSCNYETANILPGETYGLDRDFYIGNNNVKYIETIISSITYKDGSTWTTEGLDMWEKDMENNFSVENYKNEIEQMKGDALKAKENPYVKIVSEQKYNDNQFSSKEDLVLKIENIGEKPIRKIEFVVAAYDNNGYSSNFNFGYILPNMQRCYYDSNILSPGARTELTWTLFFEPNMKRFNTEVFSVEFQDGTKWNNEYIGKWMIYNEEER